MCSIPALAAASIATSAFGTVIGMAGQLRQASLQKSIMKQDAEIAEMQADDAIDRGREEERRWRMKVRQLAASETAKFAARGVSLGAGTPSDVVASIFHTGELDAMTIRANARREAWAYRTQAQGYRSQAGLYQAAGVYGATSSLLTGAATVSGQWASFKDKGIFS